MVLDLISWLTDVPGQSLSTLAPAKVETQPLALSATTRERGEEDSVTLI